MLGLGKTRFFALFQTHRADPAAFSIAYAGQTLSWPNISSFLLMAAELLMRVYRARAFPAKFSADARGASNGLARGGDPGIH